MSKMRDYLQKTSVTFIARFLGILITLAISMIVARVLGPEGQGQFAVAMSLALIGVQLSNLGLHAANTFFVAQDIKLLPPLLGNSILVSIGGGLIIAPLLLFGSYLFPNAVPIQGLLLWIVIAWVPIGLAMTLLQSLCLGLQRVELYNYSELFKKLLLLGMISIAAWMEWLSPTSAVFLSCGVIFVHVAIMGLYLGQGLHSPPKPSMSLIKSSSSYGLNAYLAALFSFLTLRFDLLMIEYFLGNSAAGEYSIAVTLADGVYTLPIIAGMILFAKLSAETNNQYKWTFSKKIIWGILSIVIPLSIVTGLFAHHIISLVFGESFIPAATPLILLLPGICALSVATLCQNLLATSGRPSWMVYGPLVACALNIPLNYYFIPIYGTPGAAVASSLCYFLWMFIALALGQISSHLNFSETVSQKDTQYSTDSSIDTSILIVSRTDWRENPRIRHQLSWALAQNYHVVFIEIPKGWILHGLKTSKLKPNMEPNIDILSLGNILMPPERIWVRFVWVRKYIKMQWVKSLQKFLPPQRLKKKIIIFNFCHDFPEIFNFKSNLNVYFCNDDFIALSHPNLREDSRVNEELVAKKANICLSISYPLVERFSKVNKNSFLFLPGHSFLSNDYNSDSIFKKTNVSRLIRVGYLGYINNRLNYDWLVAISQHKKMELHLAGPMDAKMKKFKSFTQAEKTHLYPPVYKDKLLEWLKDKDVLILPYINNEINVAIAAPNKFFQYMASGKDRKSVV